MLSRYISILSASEQLSDPSMVTGIEEEINRSKKLVAKLKTSLKGRQTEICRLNNNSFVSCVCQIKFQGILNCYGTKSEFKVQSFASNFCSATSAFGPANFLYCQFSLLLHRYLVACYS